MSDNQQRAAEAIWGLNSDPGVMLPKDERLRRRVAAELDAAEARGRAEATARIAQRFDEMASPTLHGDPFILASEWAARIVRSRAIDPPAGADSGEPTSDRSNRAARTVGPVADHRPARPGTYR